MAWRPHSKFTVNPKSPRALGLCQRCNRVWNLENLRWQWIWAGTRMTNIMLRVCQPCLDIPNENLRAIALPADPLPVWQPRTDPNQTQLLQPPAAQPDFLIQAQIPPVPPQTPPSTPSPIAPIAVAGCIPIPD